MTSSRARRATLWVAVLCAVAVTACVPRRVPAAPGALAYPEYVFPSDSGDSAAVAARVERGWQYLQGNNLKAAAREVRDAVSGAPQSVAARTAQGYVALANRQHETALRAFDASLGRRAGFVPALVGRAHALLALDRDGDALPAFERALAADGSLADVRRQVEVLRFRRVQTAIDAARAAKAAKRMDEARLRYTQAIEASPDSAFLYRERAALEREQGRDDVALADLRRAATLEPSDVETLTALGSVLAARGEFRDAVRVYRQAQALDPSDALRAEIARLALRARDAGLPDEFRSIGSRPQVSRGELASLLGVRFESVLTTVPPVQLVMTDLRNDWTRPLIATVAGAGVMEPYANHTFQPTAPALRADLAAAVWRLLALAAPTRPAVRGYLAERPRIADVAQRHPLYPAAAASVAAGVVPLLDGDRFGASGGLSGAEATAAIGRLQALLAIE
jgi:tetratricopeptide (TPR) repeat protein